MIAVLWRRFRVYSALAELAPKLYTAYRAWFWMELFVQVLALVIFVYFWRAVYGAEATLGGLSLPQTLSYIMLAQMVLPVVQSTLAFRFGQMLVHGEMVMELLRPVDLQLRFYVEGLAFVLIKLATKIPLLVFAWWVFDLELTADPRIWAAFLITLLLGHAVVFLFDWSFASLAFYTTESWGLSMVQQSIATFFSGALIPLALMPSWLERLTLALPFAQGLWVPVSLLSGIASIRELPFLCAVQIAWILGLLLLSRLSFGMAVRKITVQGG